MDFDWIAEVDVPAGTVAVEYAPEVNVGPGCSELALRVGVGFVVFAVEEAQERSLAAMELKVLLFLVADHNFDLVGGFVEEEAID